MGIIFRQSFKNTLIIYSGFIIGGINAVIFYPNFLKEEYHGLVIFLLSYSNLIMPLIALGVHSTIIKFFSSYQTKEEKDSFLFSIIFIPLLIALPIGFFWNYFHEFIVSKLNAENQKVENYTFSIYIIAVCCAYFEVFYAWTKVQLKTVLGNVLKEFYNRGVVMLLLIAVFFEFITKSGFICLLTGFYILRTLIMLFYALKVYIPDIVFKFPKKGKEIVQYSGYIFLAGSASAIILDIDKLMIPGKEAIKVTGYYAVAVYIGSFIEAPGRAMSQILQPLTSKSINENNLKEVENLYKKSSVNLLIISGLFFLLVNCNVTELFRIIPEGYSGGKQVVLMISFAKMYSVFLGNNRDIINNSRFYRITLPVGLGMAISVYILNKLFYFKMNYNTEGLAFATLLTIFVFNSFKLWFVHKKMKINPFTSKTILIFSIISVLFLTCYFWNFSIPEIYLYNIPVHPIINILLKSMVITSIYLYAVVKFKISEQINSLADRFIK